MRTGPIAFLCAALLATACAETDREAYRAGETGSVSFRNGSGVTVYLDGCSHFQYEMQVGSKWVPKGPAAVCVWEGFARPVPPGGVVREPFAARDPGIWRLRYPVGFGCSEAAPLREGDCKRIVEVESNPFEVAGSGCVVSGCSGQICADREWASTCEWLPHYACYREARCGPFGPGGSCAWEETPELLACLADPAAGGR